MTDSILVSTKKLLGITQEQTDFDTDIIITINTAFSILHDLGIGPSEGFSIDGASSTWSSYISDNVVLLEKVKTYVYLKTRLYFDPPTNSFLLDSMKSLVQELEWRLNSNVDYPEKKEKSER